MIWAISDLHFDPIGDKSMDIFGEKWNDHQNKIIENWKTNVNDSDLVLLGGDTSWGLRLEEAKIDLEIIDSLPGTKGIIKGNHDYWWGTMNKLKGLGLESINFIHNNHLIYKDVVVFGTRGWDPRDSSEFTEQDEKIFSRELNRLELSLNSYKGDLKKKIAIIHYPPFNIDGTPNEFLEILSNHGVKSCIYGHIHGPGLEYVMEGTFLGVDVRCVSSDYIDFNLVKLYDESI